MYGLFSNDTGLIDQSASAIETLNVRPGYTVLPLPGGNPRLYMTTSGGLLPLPPRPEGIWRFDRSTQAWVDPRPPEQIAQSAASQARKRRTELLAETDWVVTRAYESGSPVLSQWISYRQALRDIPEQPGFPLEVVWPTRPTT